MLGNIYIGVNIISGQEVAIKLESVKTKHPSLEHESRVYKALTGGVGIPLVRWYGSMECDYNALVLEHLGPSLEELFESCSRRFSLKTVLLLADQLVRALLLTFLLLHILQLPDLPHRVYSFSKLYSSQYQARKHLNGEREAQEPS